MIYFKNAPDPISLSFCRYRILTDYTDRLFKKVPDTFFTSIKNSLNFEFYFSTYRLSSNLTYFRVFGNFADKKSGCEKPLYWSQRVSNP